MTIPHYFFPKLQYAPASLYCPVEELCSQSPLDLERKSIQQRLYVLHDEATSLLQRYIADTRNSFSRLRKAPELWHEFADRASRHIITDVTSHDYVRNSVISVTDASAQLYDLLSRLHDIEWGMRIEVSRPGVLHTPWCILSSSCVDKLGCSLEIAITEENGYLPIHVSVCPEIIPARIDNEPHILIPIRLYGSRVGTYGTYEVFVAPDIYNKTKTVFVAGDKARRGEIDGELYFLAPQRYNIQCDIFGLVPVCIDNLINNRTKFADLGHLVRTALFCLEHNCRYRTKTRVVGTFQRGSSAQTGKYLASNVEKQTKLLVTQSSGIPRVGHGHASPAPHVRSAHTRRVNGKLVFVKASYVGSKEQINRGSTASKSTVYSIERKRK